jgi:hypothetical protein
MARKLLVAIALVLGLVSSTVALPGAASATASCPTGQTVTTAAQLTTAIATATPGAVINLVGGVTYVGPFETTVSGTQAAPITLCGPSNAIVDGKSKSRIFHLNGASWWRISGFEMRNGNKGLGLTHASHNEIADLYIHNTSGASVHINSFSTDNTIDHLTLRDSGAEGVYVGSAYGNWCAYSNCVADASDRNLIQNSDIAYTDDEPIDIKEGSTGGQVLNNYFDGIGTSVKKGWINVKGNNYLISGNVGVNTGDDGFQVHRVIQGWGNNNTFTGNSATNNGPGYGFYVQGGSTGNSIACGQTVVAAGSGYSNVACQP